MANDVGTCGCYRSTEGNNVCVNETDDEGDFILSESLTTCNSTQDCRETVGFNFWCRAVNRNENNLVCGSTEGRCWPTCDNPTVFRERSQGRAAHDAPQRRKAARRAKGRGRRS